VLRVFLASPGDTSAERDVARTAIARWNVNHAQHEGVVLLPVGWETDAVPEWGQHPQDILNVRLLDSCDALVGILWTRLGTPTPSGRSGTVEEIERFAATGKPVLLYFSRRAAELGAIDTDQLVAVREYEASCRDHALYDSFGDDAEFEVKLDRALTRIVRDHTASTAPPLPRGRRLDAPPSARLEARLGAHLERQSKGYRLVVANTGTVDVLDVNVTVPPEAKSFHLMTSSLPIDVLRPGERVGLAASTVMAGGPSIFDIGLSGVTAEGVRLEIPVKISI
jgi:hypothetical protein